MTKSIQKLIGRMLVLKYHSPVCENVKDALGIFEMDILSINKSGMLYEFEVKISRQDFLKDKKKIISSGISKLQMYSHIDYKKRTPNYFSYACPKNMIKLNEISSSVGLYYIDGEDVIEVQKPKALHKLIHDKTKILERVCRLTSERIYLGCARLTYENNKLNEQYRTDPVNEST